jgi:hypothetical protein
MLLVSNDTVLRVVRRRALARTEPLTVVCIDDWAIRRIHRYGTIVCDLERRRIVTPLPKTRNRALQALTLRKGRYMKKRCGYCHDDADRVGNPTIVNAQRAVLLKKNGNIVEALVPQRPEMADRMRGTH